MSRSDSKSMEALMAGVTQATGAADKAKAVTIVKQLIYLAAYSNGQPIGERHDDLVWLRSYIENLP